MELGQQEVQGLLQLLARQTVGIAQLENLATQQTKAIEDLRRELDARNEPAPGRQEGE